MSNTHVLGLLFIAVLAACEQKKPPPVPTPASIKVQLSSKTCREGTTMTLAATVLDADGGVVPAPVTWTTEPPSIIEVNGPSIRCAKEGTAQVQAKVGTLDAKETINVVSPLVGRWERVGEDDEKAGLMVEVVQEADQLNAHVMRAPTDAALPAYKKNYPGSSPTKALACVQKTWSPGTKKWKSIRRISPTTWSLSDLAKDLRFSDFTCVEGRSYWLDDYELTLMNPDRADVQSSIVGKKAIVQHWARTSLQQELDGAAPVDASSARVGAVSTGADAGRGEVAPPGRPAKVVKVEVIDVKEAKSASVRVGDTLQVTVPQWTGTEWKIMGDQPTDRDFVSGYLGPGTDGMKYVWKITGESGKRTIKFIGTDANTPNAAPQVVNVAVTVE